MAKVVKISYVQYLRYKSGQCNPPPTRYRDILTNLLEIMYRQEDIPGWQPDSLVRQWEPDGKTTAEHFSFLLAIAGGYAGWLDAGLQGLAAQPKVTAVLTRTPTVHVSVTCLSGKVTIQSTLGLSDIRTPTVTLVELRPNRNPELICSMPVTEKNILHAVYLIQTKVQGPPARLRFGIYN